MNTILVKNENRIRPLSSPLIQIVALIAILTVLYFIAGKFGLLFAKVNQSVSAIWPPTGIALAFVLMFGYRLWTGIFLGAFLVNFTMTGSLLTSVGIAFGNTLEALVAAYLINRFADGTEFKNSVGNTFRFIMFAGIIAPVIAAVIGCLSLLLTGFAVPNTLNYALFTWWLGDGTGALLLTPLIILWRRLSDFKSLESRAVATEVFFALLFIFVTGLIVFDNLVPALRDYPIAFIIIPPLMWIAIRLGRREAMTGIFILSILAIQGTLSGHGEFAHYPIEKSLVFLQVYLAAVAGSTLIFSVLAYQERRNRKNLAMSEKRFRSLIENSSDAIALIDIQRTILYASKSILRLLGYTPEELVGKPKWDFIHPEDRERSGRTLSDLGSLDPGSICTIEVRMIRKDGEIRWIEMVGANALTDPAVNAITLNLRDITERREFANTKSNFISTISHRLHPPLSQIETYINALGKSKSKFSQLDQKYIEKINSANQEAITLNSDLLRLMRIELGTIMMTPKVIDARKTMNSVFREFIPQVQSKGISIERLYPPGPAFFTIDENLAILVLRRLLSQIIEFTPRGNKIGIQIVKREPEIFILISYPHASLPHSDVKQLNFKLPMSKFKNTDDSDLPLGSYTMESLIELMDGKIRFEPQEQGGEILSLSFPDKPRAYFR